MGLRIPILSTQIKDPDFFNTEDSVRDAANAPYLYKSRTARRIDKVSM